MPNELITIDSLYNAIVAVKGRMDAIEKRIDTLEDDVKTKVSKANLSSMRSSVELKISQLSSAVDAVEDKAQNVLSPNETISFIGKDELNTLKTRLVQMLAIKQEIDDVKKQLFSMLTSFKAGQEGIVL